MRHTIAIGVGLVLVLGSLAAGCAAPGTMPEEEPVEQRPYRIQVHMTPNKEEAERRLDQVRSWWSDLPEEARPAPLAASGLHPDIVWQQPYYRVRIGQFATRQDAQEALAAVREQFSDAFIARERISAARR